MRKPPIPNTFNREQQGFLRDVLTAADEEFRVRPTKTEVLDQVLLASPSKKVYAIRVSDAGVISAVLVQE